MRTLIAASLALFALASDAHAGAAEDLLAKMEQVMSNFKDSTITFEVINLKPGTSTPQTMGFITRVKGGKSLTEFTAPGDLKGTRVLSLSPTELYVWLPEFQKIRRVTTSTTEQGFMGTVLTQQDMAPPAWSKLFDIAGMEDTGADAVLSLKAKAGVEVSYKQLKVTVRKDLAVPIRIEYLSDAGAVVRTETRDGYSCNNGYCLFGTMMMTDHARGAWTQLKPKAVQLNTGLGDDLFTQRALQFGM